MSDITVLTSSSIFDSKLPSADRSMNGNPPNIIPTKPSHLPVSSISSFNYNRKLDYFAAISISKAKIALSVWLELSHPFHSLTRDKDLHTFPKRTRCHHNKSMQPFQTFFEIDTIVIYQGRRLQRRRHLNSTLLLECGLTDSIR